MGESLRRWKINGRVFLWVLKELGRDVTDHPSCLLRRPEDEAYDEDGNPLRDFYDAEPPGAGSPASALHDAYALYYPAERRYYLREARAARPGTRWGAGRKEQDGGPQSRFIFLNVLKPLFSLLDPTRATEN